MRTITIFKKTENRTVKNEIIHNMQPDDMQRKLSGSISRELNCIDSLSCDIYPDNPGYEMLVPCLTEIQCIDDNDVEFLGRVLKAVPLMDNNGVIYKQVTCEGYLAYLQDSSTDIEPFNMSPVDMAKELIKRHNSSVPQHTFQIEFDQTVTDTEKAELSTSGGTTFDEFSALISKYNWEILLSYKVVDGKAVPDKLTVSKKIGKICGDSVIEIGNNLLSYSCEQDMSNLCTRILPLGTKVYTDEDNLERVSIASVNSGKKYLSKNENLYGVIQRTILYEDIKEPKELLKEAEKYIEAYSEPYSSYTISAIDPHLLDNTKEKIKVGNWYKVNAKLLGIDGVMLRVNKQTISLDNPANDSFSVGNTTAATASGSIAGAVTGEKLSLIVDQSNTQNVVVTKQLAAQEAWIKDLKASSITTDNLVAKVAQIDSLTATDAIIKNIVAQTITTDNITAAVGNIKNLTSDSAIIDTIRNTIITSDFSDSVVARMSNGVIKSALIESLSADKIAAGKIYTDDVQIQSKDGCMVLKDSTMQISDGNQVRVQIGKDANDNYTIIIYDENGNVLWGEGGITENAIRDGLINDKMVDDNANINAKKINLPSLIKEINDGTETIKSSAINYDPTGQTLDVTFNRIESQLLDDLGYNLYYDSQTMKDGWSFVGNYLEVGEKQWDREYKHYECKIFRLSGSYSYIDNSFMPEDGKVYTLSAYIKGRAMVYYPVGLEVGDVYEFSEATRVKYDFTYDSKKGKPVFTPADDSGSIEIYAIKLEYGGAMTAYCLTADEEGREEKVQMSAFHVSSTNLKSEFYEKDKENKKKFSLISQTVDEIKTKVGVIDGDYITGSELKQTAKEINDKVSEIYQTKDGMNNYAKSSELSLKADKATLGNYQTIAGMSSYATTTWAQQQISSKVSVGDVCSEINQSSEQITLNSNRLVIDSTNFSLDRSGNVSMKGKVIATSGKIGPFQVYPDSIEIATGTLRGTRIYNDHIDTGYIYSNDGTLDIGIPNNPNSTRRINIWTSSDGVYINDKFVSFNQTILNSPSTHVDYTSAGNVKIQDTTGYISEDSSGYGNLATVGYVKSKVSSDERIKKNIVNMPDNIKDIYMDIPMYQFEYDDILERDGICFGTTAQAVEKAFEKHKLDIDEYNIVGKRKPSAFNGEDKHIPEGDNLHYINWENINGMTVYMIQELVKEMEILKHEINELKQKEKGEANGNTSYIKC